MKITSAEGSQFELRESLPSPIFIPVEVRVPGQDMFFRVMALVDTGSSVFMLPEQILKDLGVSPQSIALDSIVAQTAGGSSTEKLTKIDLRIVGMPSGKAALFSGIVATVSPKTEVPLIGQNLLRYFRVQFSNNKIQYMEFDPKSVTAAQEEAASPSNVVMLNQIKALQNKLNIK